MDKYSYSTYLDLDPTDETCITFGIVSKDYDLSGVQPVVDDFIADLKDYLRGVE